jgi:hypothetical protein
MLRHVAVAVNGDGGMRAAINPDNFKRTPEPGKPKGAYPAYRFIGHINPAGTGSRSTQQLAA